MKKYVLFIILLVVFQACGNLSKNETPGERAAALRQEFKWENGSPPMISAHRGGPVPDYPENCIPTFQRAVDLGAKIIECDVRSSSDGFLILMHDKTLERTTSGHGMVSEKPLRDLLTLSLLDESMAVTPYQIPLLSNVLNWAKEADIYLTLDIKAVEATHLISVIREQKAEGHVIIIVYNYEDMMRYHSLAPELMLSVSAGTLGSIETLFSYPIPKDRLMVFTGTREAKGAVYDLLHENSIFSITGTMHNLDNKAKKEGFQVYQDLYRNGADILSTDNVEGVSRAIRDLKKY